MICWVKISRKVLVNVIWLMRVTLSYSKPFQPSTPNSKLDQATSTQKEWTSFNKRERGNSKKDNFFMRQFKKHLKMNSHFNLRVKFSHNLSQKNLNKEILYLTKLTMEAKLLTLIWTFVLIWIKFSRISSKKNKQVIKIGYNKKRSKKWLRCNPGI